MKFSLSMITALLLSCTTHQGDKKFQKPKEAFYTQNQNERQKGEVYVPEGAGPFPGIVLVHGGGWYSRDYRDMNSIAKSLAGHGFVVYNINYRFAPEHLHPAPIDDLKTALTYFKKNAADFKLDTKRIGLWGYSSGGHIVSDYALTFAHDEAYKIQAVVAGGAPFDFTWYDQSPIINKYMGGFRDKKLSEYYAASPMYKITRGAPPFFLYHARNDKLVEYAQAMAFEARLKSFDVPVNHHEIGWWGHATAFMFSEAAVVAGVNFLEGKLK